MRVGDRVTALFTPGRHRSAEVVGDHLEIDADVAILGAGAGGCAAAAALAESGVRVAVLEEGQFWNPAQFRQSSSWALRNLYQERGTRSMRGNSVIPIPGGRGVGGSTLVNSAICFRCPDPILDRWHDEFGCTTVTKERFHPYFDRIWETLGVTTQSAEIQRLNNTTFKKRAEALGLNGHFLARSAPGCVGCGICQYGCPSGGKASVDRTFLVEALSHGNVAVYADCMMTGVEKSGDRILAVTGDLLDADSQAPRGTVRVRADAFIVSAGPIMSPSFLLRNHLSAPAHCGQHLCVHPGLAGMGRMPFEIRPWHGVTQGYYVDCWDKGYLLQTFSVTPDQYYGLMSTKTGAESMEWMANLKYICSAGPLVHDEDSVGQVTWTPFGPDISYFMGDGDKRKLIDGLRMTGHVMFAAGAERFMPAVVQGPIVLKAGDIDAALPHSLPASHLHAYASHPMGTCRMGNDAATSVVDPHGKVWGWQNLRVADASVFPTSLGVNPQVTTMSMGLMIGHSLAGKIP